MLINPTAPVRSFLTGCLFLAAVVTAALMVWTLKQESGAAHCAPGGGALYGVCMPTADFLMTAVVWYLLIFGALAMPIVSILALRWFAKRRDGGGS